MGVRPTSNLADLMFRGKTLKDIITVGPEGIGFISGGSGITGLANLSRDYLNYIIQNLAKLDAIADIIIVDTGAGISDAVLDFLVASGEILSVNTILDYIKSNISNFNWKYKESSKFDVQKFELDTTKLKSILRDYSFTSFNEGLEQTIKWVRTI